MIISALDPGPVKFEFDEDSLKELENIFELENLDSFGMTSIVGGLSLGLIGSIKNFWNSK